MSWFDPSAPIQNDDIDSKRILIEQLMKQANAIRATTPRGTRSMHDNITPGPYGRYVMPIAEMTQQIIDPLVAHYKEQKALDTLREMQGLRSAATSKAIETVPQDLKDKNAVLKWAVEASQAQNPVLEHILPQVLRSTLGGDRPFISIGQGATMDPDTGEVKIVPELAEAKQAEEDRKRKAKLEDAITLERTRAELRGTGTREMDPLTKQIKEKQLQKLNMEVGRKSDGRPLTAGIEKEVQGLAEDLSNAKRLRDTFSDDFAGSPTKHAEKIIGNVLGGIAPESAQKNARWWQDYEYFKNIPERFSKFGASLTANEKRAWDSATINPRMTPETIREKMSVQLRILKNKADAIRESQKAAGSNIGQIDAYFKQYGLMSNVPEGRDLMSDTEIKEEDLKPGDRLGGAIWNGSQFVQPDEYSPGVDLGTPVEKPVITDPSRRFKVLKVE